MPAASQTIFILKLDWAGLSHLADLSPSRSKHLAISFLSNDLIVHPLKGCNTFVIEYLEKLPVVSDEDGCTGGGGFQPDGYIISEALLDRCHHSTPRITQHGGCTHNGFYPQYPPSQQRQYIVIHCCLIV